MKETVVAGMLAVAILSGAGNSEAGQRGEIKIVSPGNSPYSVFYSSDPTEAEKSAAREVSLAACWLVMV